MHIYDDILEGKAQEKQSANCQAGSQWSAKRNLISTKVSHSNLTRSEFFLTNRVLHLVWSPALEVQRLNLSC
jgi:hypothetical protein